jgi:hypothetical protein
MACACNSNKGQTAKAKTYVHTASSGARKTYRTEVEAVAAVKRSGGSYKSQ